IAVTKNRRVQNVDCFVVETFKDRASEVFVGINDQKDWSRFTRNHRRTTDNQIRVIKVNSELRAEEGRDRSHINMPPISGERQALDPFRAVNGPVRPFVGHLRLYIRISYNAYLRQTVFIQYPVENPEETRKRGSG